MDILPRAVHLVLVLILQSKPLFSLNLFPVYSTPPLFSAGVLFDLSGTSVCVCKGRYAYCA